MTSDLDLRISAAIERGFIVWEAGSAVAAFSTPGELALWLEHRLLGTEMPPPLADNVEPMPSVARTRIDPAATRKRGYFGTR